MSDVQGDNLVSLKQFKREKRLKQKAKRQARKLEQSTLNKKLIQQPKTTPKRQWLSASKCLVWLAVIFFGLADIGIHLIFGYMQGSPDMPEWMITANKWLPVIRNCGGILAMLGLLN